MKRAKLTQTPLAASSGGADLTDRLLGGSGGEKKKAGPAAPGPAKLAAPPKPAAKPKTARRAAPARQRATVEAKPAAAAPPSPRAGDLPKYEPYRTVEARPPVMPGPVLRPPAPTSWPEDISSELRLALAETEKALAALAAAAEGLPARHDLAVRYRLDALRHHLQQVSEFLASRRG